MPDQIVLIVIACLNKDPNICAKWQPEVQEISELWCNYGGAQSFLANWKQQHPGYTVKQYRCGRNRETII